MVGMSTLTVIGAGDGEPARIDWTDLHLRARRMATVLSGLGLGRGSRVGILGDTSIGVVTAVRAVWLAGGAVTMLPPERGRSPFLSGIVGDAALDAVLTDAGTAPAPALGTRVVSLSDVDGQAAAPCEVAPAEPGALAILQYTSGSTGSPRGVPVTHAHLDANLAAIKAAFQVGGDVPRLMSWLPLFHDMGFVGFLALPMACRWPLVLQNPLGFAMRPASWFHLIRAYRITATAAPNFAYSLLTRLLEAGLDADLSTLRFMLSGGEPIDAAAMARFVAAASLRGLDPGAVVPAYGLAEATLAVTISAPGRGLRLDTGPDGVERVRLGAPVPGTRLKVVDGRILVRGPSVVGHYWGEPAPPPGRWLDTGDLGYLADGELVVCGRRKEMLFAAGRNVYPQDIETAAAAVPGVRPGGVAAFGVPGPDGDRLIVAVEARPGDAPGLDREVAAAVAGGAGLRPAEVMVLHPGRLPKTSSGKVRRAETKRRYLSGELSTHHSRERTIL
jgi:fatty-acyl-CoA synthase